MRGKRPFEPAKSPAPAREFTASSGSAPGANGHYLRESDVPGSLRHGSSRTRPCRSRLAEARVLGRFRAGKCSFSRLARLPPEWAPGGRSDASCRVAHQRQVASGCRRARCTGCQRAGRSNGRRVTRCRRSVVAVRRRSGQSTRRRSTGTDLLHDTGEPLGSSSAGQGRRAKAPETPQFQKRRVFVFARELQGVDMRRVQGDDPEGDQVEGELAHADRQSAARQSRGQARRRTRSPESAREIELLPPPESHAVVVQYRLGQFRAFGRGDRGHIDDPALGW